MAEYVQVVVNVDKTQLYDLQKNISDIKNTRVNIKIDGSGEDIKGVAVSVKDIGTAANQAGKEITFMGDVLGRIKWRAINAAIDVFAKTIRDAVGEMKAVDTELTNIRKVSGATSEEIERIGDAAYETASKYGVAASEYLQAVYTFQKAGLGDSAEKLGELATKTMLVGDTTAEVATQFLVSANAAWKLGGSYEALSKIVDEADYINNNYATTLADIATGLPIVGATAAQVGLTTEQTMAAIGTIVASTGQSATKAATALRAIIMNLVGETGELEDGTQVTEETIASLNSVLNEYAADSLAAANAAGKILDPMEAIAALAQAAEDGFLNEAQLFEVLSGLGGKLRTTQLTALVNNLEMYNSMLEGTADAAGTADSEISIMLDSWESKTQILKNTWTEFISHLVDTDLIKGAIDGLTDIVRVLDTDFGHFLVTVGTVTVALVKLKDAIGKIKAVKSIAGGSSFLTSILGISTPQILAAVAALTAIYFIGKKITEAVKQHNQKLIEQLPELEKQSEEKKKQLDDSLKELEATKEKILFYEELYYESGQLSEKELENYQLLIKQYDTLRNQTVELEQQNNKLDRQIEKRKRLADASIINEIALLKGEMSDLPTSNARYQHLLDSGYLDQIKDILQNSDNYSRRTQKLAQELIGLIDSSGMLIDTIKNLSDEAEDADKKAEDATDAINGVVDSMIKLSQHEGEASYYSKELGDSFEDLMLKAYLFSDAVITLRNKLGELIAQGTRLELEQLGSRAYDHGFGNTIHQELDRTGIQKQIQALIAARRGRQLDGSSTSGGRSGSTTGGRSGSTTDEQLEQYKSIVSLEKQRLAYMEASGASTEDQVAKMRDIQKALHVEAKHLRSIEGESERVIALSTEWWNYQNKINDLLEKAANELLEKLKDEMESLLDTAEDFLDSQEEAATGPLKEQLELLKAQKDELDEAAELEEKLLAVEKARIALENAQNQRNVRVYNAATGDWEWAANAANVQSARESLASANQALSDFYENQAYNARVAALEKQIEDTEATFENLRSSVDSVADALKNGSLTIEQAFNSLLTVAAQSGVNGFTGAISSAAASTGLKDFVIDKMKANSAAWSPGRTDLENENLALGTSLGWTRGADGVWYDANGNRAYDTYDTGGILHGMGGIKATASDEMVIPPRLTSGLLEAERNGTFSQLLNHLGIVTAAANSYAGFGGGMAANSIGSQYNGDSYNFGSITLTEDRARSTTVYELAQMARTLSLHNA